MLFEGSSQLIGIGCFRHFRKRFVNLLLRVIDILEGVDEEFAKILVCHDQTPLIDVTWGQHEGSSIGS